jgi:hypothetical protein
MQTPTLVMLPAAHVEIASTDVLPPLSMRRVFVCHSIMIQNEHLPLSMRIDFLKIESKSNERNLLEDAL